MASDLLGESERRLIQQEMFQLEDQKLILEEKYQYLFENALSGLFRLDGKTGKVLAANKELLNTFKVEQFEELNYLFKHYGILGELAELKNKLPQEETMTFSIPVLVNTDERMIQFSSRYQSEYGVIEGAAKDITSLVEAEKRLVEAVKEAEQANHAKSIFLANMSHEIRTPLNGIVGFAELIERGNSPEHTEYARKILDESDRLMTLINQLLDISKIEANQIYLDSQPFCLRNLVQDHFDFFLPRLNEKGLEWNIDIDDNVSEVYIGDAFRIGQVITNLISNAVKFTAKGKISIHISLINAHNKIHELSFIIKDSGIGIPLEKHKAVFDKFIQADNSIERRFGGTGLGIAICKELVELMGGSITLKSQPGAGSSFTFVIPLKPGRRNLDRAKFVSHDDLENPDIPPSRILLVEDYKVNQDVILLQLKDSPLTIDVAENGNRAVELFVENNYDLILMDVHMPHMSGLEAAKKIRQIKKGHHIPIIGMSASAFYTDREECRRVGMNDFLSKPIRRRKLLNHLVFWLKESEKYMISRNNPWETEGPAHIHNDSFLLRYEEFCLEIESREESNEIIEGYIDSAQGLLQDILNNIKSHDWITAHRNSHSLKGGALNIMADELSERAFKLESALKEPHSHDIMPLYHSVSQSFMRLKGEFEKIKDKYEG